MRTDSGRGFFGRFGNVEWKERVDGWRLKQDKNVAPDTNGVTYATSEGRGFGDVESTIDYNMDDGLL